MKRVMFISSVGGHLTQLLELKSIFENYEYVLITEKTDVTKSMKDKYNMTYLTYGSRNQKLLYPFILIGNCFKFSYQISSECNRYNWSKYSCSYVLFRKIVW